MTWSKYGLFTWQVSSSSWAYGSRSWWDEVRSWTWSLWVPSNSEFSMILWYIYMYDIYIYISYSIYIPYYMNTISVTNHYLSEKYSNCTMETLPVSWCIITKDSLVTAWLYSLLYSWLFFVIPHWTQEFISNRDKLGSIS